MDKLKRVLSGNDSPDEESGIMSQVRNFELAKKHEELFLFHFS